MFSRIQTLNKETISQSLVKSEYAVRGYLPTLAAIVKRKLKEDPNSYPFSDVVNLSIGNPLVFNTKPIWTFRQVLSEYLRLDFPHTSHKALSHSNAGSYIRNTFIDYDEHARWKEYHQIAAFLQLCENVSDRTAIGGHPESKRSIARMIETRDGYPADPAKIFLSNGASSAIRMFMDLLIDKEDVGVMVPVPQYPLYSALITLHSGQAVPYYLDEDNNWQIHLDEIKKAYEQSKEKGIKPKAIVMINPGNPTGNVFDRQSMEQIIAFAHANELLIIADEVYQENVYNKKQWLSFKKVLAEAPSTIAKEVELVSFHSLSKGLLGECGMRGGYVDFVNIDPEFMAEFEKAYSVVWPNPLGQAIMTLKCDYLSGHLEKRHSKHLCNQIKVECDEIFQSLQFRANEASRKLNEALNIRCNTIEGAMYAFPQIYLPPKLIEEAKKVNMKPDVFYCKMILERWGLCFVPGSGFGQREGTFHFRTTILPTPDEYFSQVFDRFKEANNTLINEFS